MVAQPVPQERVAIYVRVSTDRQEEEGTSLGSQEERARAYCQSLGYIVSAVYRETYSGFELHRPELNQLREAIRSGSADVVVAYAVDRLSRNQAHLAILIHVFWLQAHRWLYVAIYLLLGWAAVMYLPQLWQASVAMVILVAIGGLLYTGGAIVYAMKRPNPWPGHFGFHEIFHVCTDLAFLCQWTACLLIALNPAYHG